MDKGTFILAAGFTIIVGMYALNMNRADSATRDNSDAYAYKRQARQIALSGIALATNKFRDDLNWETWVGELQDTSLMEGTLNVTIDSSGLPSGYRRIMSQGYYFGQNHSAEGIVHAPPPSVISTFDTTLLKVYATVDMRGQDFKVESFTYNKFRVRGDSAVATYGMGGRQTTLPGSKITYELTHDNVRAQDSVTGTGGNPSVTTLLVANNTVANGFTMARLGDSIRTKASITYSRTTLGDTTYWGSGSSPKIVYVSGSLQIDKPLTGVGILFIYGQLHVKSTMNWQGYLLVHSDRIQVYSGKTMDLKGAVFFGDESGVGNLNFLSSGTMKITYSPNILSTIKQKLITVSSGRPSLVRTYEHGIYD